MKSPMHKSQIFLIPFLKYVTLDNMMQKTTKYNNVDVSLIIIVLTI